MYCFGVKWYFHSKKDYYYCGEVRRDFIRHSTLLYSQPQTLHNISYTHLMWAA